MDGRTDGRPPGWMGGRAVRRAGGWVGGWVILHLHLHRYVVPSQLLTFTQPDFTQAMRCRLEIQQQQPHWLEGRREGSR